MKDKHIDMKQSFDGDTWEEWEELCTSGRRALWNNRARGLPGYL